MYGQETQIDSAVERFWVGERQCDLEETRDPGKQGILGKYGEASGSKVWGNPALVHVDSQVCIRISSISPVRLATSGILSLPPSFHKII